jgi:hypothetical protein
LRTGLRLRTSETQTEEDREWIRRGLDPPINNKASSSWENNATLAPLIPLIRWKFNPDDLKERAFWNDYMEAYEQALRRCSRKYAPWYVVPAEHKWFRTMVVSELIRNVLEDMDPRYPTPAFDPDQFDPDSLV